MWRSRKFIGWSVLAVAACLGGAWLLQLDRTEKISTDVLDLLPAGERSPELTLVRQLASQAEARTMLFELTVDGRPAPADTAARFAAALRKEAAFAAALALSDPTPRDELGAALFAERFTLLFPRWLAVRETRFAELGRDAKEFSPWLADETAAALERFLSAPEAMAWQEILPADPLLLMAEAVGELRGSLALVQPAAAAAATVVWAQLTASPLSEAGQQPAFAAIERARAFAQGGAPALEVAYTGINRFAAASRGRIEGEVAWLNTLSLLAVLGVAFAFIRRVHRGLHLLPVILLAMLGAWTGTTLLFDRVHVLVFVVGSLLTGVAIDYSFYLFMQPPRFPGEDYWLKARRLAKPLLASCFTTVAGFALLLFSELPLIRQLGAFVATGLVCALAAAVIYFSTVANPFLETRAFRGGRALSPESRRRARRILAMAWLFALPGLAWLTWRDDIRELEIPAPEIQREDARIRALLGDRGDRTVFLSHGATLAESRESLERLEAWLNKAGGERTEFSNLGVVVPTAAQHARAVTFLRDETPRFLDALRAAMARHDFAAEDFAPFFAVLSRAAATAKADDLPGAVARLRAKLVGPAGLLVHEGAAMSWFVTLAQNPPADPPPPEASTVTASQLQSLNSVFARYRQTALWFSLGGLVIVGGGVLLTYGLRDGGRIFLIPLGTCLGVFGVFGWLGLSLNLFHLLGAFLGVCLLHNYSIFTATSAFRGEPPPASVRLSALTTAASFGVLALSGIPVVRALGSTVALMVLAALLVIECELLATLGKTPPSAADHE